MDAVIPWARLLKLIEPHYHPASRCCQLGHFDPATGGGV